MIELIGQSGTAEFAAAEQLAEAFEKQWPGIRVNDAGEDLIKIAASAKLSGYKVSDIDLVVAARLSRGRHIAPKSMFLDSNGKKVAGGKIAVRSFVVAIEVKDHPPSGVRAEAGGISVRYKDGWKNATEQNEQQRYALLNYLQDLVSAKPWTYRCVMMRGLPALPTHRGRSIPSAGAVASGFNATSFLLAMASVNGVREAGGSFDISSAPRDTINEVFCAPLFKKVTPSRLDRKRMDRIAARPPLAKDLAGQLGRQRVHLRGKGGTGKTILLLQAAHIAYEDLGQRSLILTYNHALAADIQRLLCLMGVPSGGEGGGIEVRTVMSFMYSWFAVLGICPDQVEVGYENYERLCCEALDLLRAGAITGDDLRQARQGVGDQFDYDAVLVDEAQDWPQAEADLLCALYGGQTISITDGVDQLVRGSPTDWKTSIGGQKAPSFHSFQECLRMKSNLAVFANAVGARAGLNWRVEPSREGAGGRVLLLRGPYSQHVHLHHSLLENAAEAGNSPVDFLHCVPPSGILIDGNQRISEMGRAFRKRDLDVWDGVDPAVRRNYPRSPKEHRIVQYESCRGLEGWTTVLDGLDEFWDRKRLEALEGLSRDPSDGFRDEALLAKHVAWRWVLIALTRPIDTLVITLSGEENEFSSAMKAVAGGFADIVDNRFAGVPE